MPSFVAEVCILSLYSLLSSFLVLLHMVTLKYGAYVRLALLLVVLLNPFIFPGWSTLMALMALLKSVQWDVTQMS